MVESSRHFLVWSAKWTGSDVPCKSSVLPKLSALEFVGMLNPETHRSVFNDVHLYQGFLFGQPYGSLGSLVSLESDC